MTTLDQLEIVHPDGSVGFYDLEPVKGTTNIGSDPENDVVIESPEVPPFLAMIDHRVKPYQIMILDQAGQIELDGQPLVPNQGYDLHGWSTVSINGHSLVLTEHDVLGLPMAARQAAPASAPESTSKAAPIAAAATAAAATSAVVHRLTLPPADHLDDYLMAELSQRENTIECEQTASYPLTVINGGDIVATFEVTIDGLDPAWVMIEPASVNLNEGERASITIAITPPRTPASRAGTHHFAVVITSPNHPERSTRLGATLNINPFYEFAISDLSPRQLSTGYRKNSRTAATALALVNRGNAEAVYRVEGEDDQRGCAFEYQQPEAGSGRSARQTEVRLAPEATTTLAVYVTPMKRRLVGLRKRSYSVTVTGMPLSGQQTPRSVLGQLQAAPLIGPWAILGITGLLTLLIIWIFHPYIDAFGLTSPSDILGGQSVTLGWQTSPFVQLKLLEEKTTTDNATTVQEVGAVTAPNGTTTFTLYETARYRLVASNLLSSLLPFLATQSEWVKVTVRPVPPVIELFNPLPVEKSTIVLGDSINLVYRVLGADKVTLVGSDGLVQSLVPTDTGSLNVAPALKTNYTLGAVNRYGTAEPKQVVIAVVTPTPTPIPTPSVVQFSVEPRTITEGQKINIIWDVTGATSIKISGLVGSDKLSARGNLEQNPGPPGVDYTLLAANGPEGTEPQTIIGPYHVTVIKAPPPPVAPQIVVFQAFPEEGIVRGNSATLQWSVTGATTGVILSGPGLPDAGLQVSTSGQQSVYPSTTAVYILTANNGTASAVKSTTVKVTEPVPAPEVTFRATSTEINETDPVGLSWEVIGDSVSRQVTGQGVVNPSVDPSGAMTVYPTSKNGQPTIRTYVLTVKYKDSNNNTQQIVRTLAITVNPLPVPVIDYFRAGCLSGAGQIVDDTECNLAPTGSSGSNTTIYQIYVGRRAYLFWRTLNATSSVTVTQYLGTPKQCNNRDGQQSPDPLNACPTDNEIQQEVQYILTARNSAGVETSRSIIFRPEVQPADPPYNLNLVIDNGTVAGPTLSLRLIWNYQKAALNSIVGFRIIRTSHGQEQPAVDVLPSVCTSADPNSTETTCSYGPLNLSYPDTCSQTFKVAALYRALGGGVLPSYYTVEVTLDSCPATGQ